MAAFDSKKERLLCYSAGILQALLANPNNKSTSIALIPSSIKAAKKLIEECYKDEMEDNDGPV